MNDNLRQRLDKLAEDYLKQHAELVRNKEHRNPGDLETKLLELHQEYVAKVKIEKLKAKY